MKLVQLTKIYWPDNGGGIARVAESIATGMLSDENSQAIVTCQKKPGMKKAKDEFGNVPVTRCKQFLDVASTPLSFEYLREVKKQTEGADVTICHHPYPMNDLAILFGKIRSKKLVYWWHCDIEQYGFLAKLYAPLVRHSLKKADVIIASSEGNIINSKLVLPFQDKCKVIPFAVSDEYFKEGAKYCASPIERKAGEPVHILFLGRMVWYKGCEYLLKAFAAMKNTNCDLTLVGGGPLEEELKQKAAELGVADRVRFTGMVSEEEKMQHIKDSDFLVLPSVSKAEAFALVQIEAMAFGKPVINTSLPSGVPYVSPAGKTGMTVEPENEEQLRDAMDEMVSNEELRLAYGKAARKMVETDYQNEKFVSMHKELFQQLLKKD